MSITLNILRDIQERERLVTANCQQQQIHRETHNTIKIKKKYEKNKNKILNKKWNIFE